MDPSIQKEIKQVKKSGTVGTSRLPKKIWLITRPRPLIDSILGVERIVLAITLGAPSVVALRAWLSILAPIIEALHPLLRDPHLPPSL